MKVTSTTQLTATLDDGTELDLDHRPADHIEPNVTIEGDTLTLRYAVVDDYHRGNPLDEECSGASLLLFDNGYARDQWLEEHQQELTDRQFLVQRYEHGLVRYSVLDTVEYPDPRWDVARGVGVLTLDDEFADLRAGPHFKVGASKAGGAQKRLGGVPAPAVFLVDFKVAHTFVVAAVEVIGRRNPRLLRRLGKGVQNVPAKPLFVDAPFPT